MSSEVDQVRQAANRVNTSLMDYAASLSDEPSNPGNYPPGTLMPPQANGVRENTAQERRESAISTKGAKTAYRDAVVDTRPADNKPLPEPPTSPSADEPSPEPSPAVDLDYEGAVNALTLQFLNEHEATRVAALAWLIMLHRKAPRKVRRHFMRQDRSSDAI